MIVKNGSNWSVVSRKGKSLGTYDTKSDAQNRLRQIEYFKHKEESINEADSRKAPISTRRPLRPLQEPQVGDQLKATVLGMPTDQQVATTAQPEPEFNKSGTREKSVERAPVVSRDELGTMLGNMRAPSSATASKMAAFNAAMARNVPSSDPEHLVAPTVASQDQLGDLRPSQPETMPMVRPHDVPAVINQGLGSVRGPRWMRLGDLPGFKNGHVRTLGGEVFKNFTREQHGEIRTIGRLHDAGGPSSEEDLQSVGAWAKKHGRELPTTEMDFQQSIPGYKAATKQYSLKGVRLMFVQDDFGKYVYAWPEHFSKEHPAELVTHKEEDPLNSFFAEYGTPKDYKHESYDSALKSVVDGLIEGTIGLNDAMFRLDKVV